MSEGGGGGAGGGAGPAAGGGEGGVVVAPPAGAGDGEGDGDGDGEPEDGGRGDDAGGVLTPKGSAKTQTLAPLHSCRGVSQHSMPHRS